MCFFLFFILALFGCKFSTTPPPLPHPPIFFFNFFKRRKKKPRKQTKGKTKNETNEENKQQAKLRLCGVLFSWVLKSQGCVAKCSSMRGFCFFPALKKIWFEFFFVFFCFFFLFLLRDGFAEVFVTLRVDERRSGVLNALFLLFFLSL